MPIINYIRSLIRLDTGSEFFYSNGYEWARDGIGAEQQEHRIPTGDSAGTDGEYQANSYLAPRTWSYKLADVSGSDYGDLESKLDALWLAHPVGPLCHLRRQVVSVTGAATTTISDRFIECRIAYRTKGAEQVGARNQPEIGIRSGKPYYQDTALSAPVALAAGGGTVTVTPGGTDRCQPVFTLTVTVAGTITILESFYGASITLIVGVGTYVIDCSQPSSPVYLGGVTTLAPIVAGAAFKLTPLPSNITLAISGGATLSSANVQWRRCWAFSN